MTEKPVASTIFRKTSNSYATFLIICQDICILNFIALFQVIVSKYGLEISYRIVKFAYLNLNKSKITQPNRKMKVVLCHTYLVEYMCQISCLYNSYMMKFIFRVVVWP